MLRSQLHINCDLGEGFGNEEKIIPLINACNLACGGHAGDTETMRKVVALSKRHRVAVGAHPSYPDKAHFGRISVNMPPDKLISSIKAQISDLETVLADAQYPLIHIKPHGALYNDLAKDKELCAAFLSGLSPYKKRVQLLAPFASVLNQMATSDGWKVLTEAFADRNYTTNYSLVDRSHPEALITEPKAIAMHLKRMYIENKLRCVEGSLLPIKADTYCFHSDGKNAASVIRQVLNELQ